MFTFTRPHKRMLEFDDQHPTAVGANAGSVKCQKGVTDLSGHNLKNDWPSTQAGLQCPGDACEKQEDCSGSPRSQGLYCSNSKTCRSTVKVGQKCPEQSHFACEGGICPSKYECTKSYRNWPCPRGDECREHLECRPGKTASVGGVKGGTAMACIPKHYVEGKGCSNDDSAHKKISCRRPKGFAKVQYFMLGIRS